MERKPGGPPGGGEGQPRGGGAAAPRKGRPRPDRDNPEAEMATARHLRGTIGTRGRGLGCRAGARFALESSSIPLVSFCNRSAAIRRRGGSARPVRTDTAASLEEVSGSDGPIPFNHDDPGFSGCTKYTGSRGSQHSSRRPGQGRHSDTPAPDAGTSSRRSRWLMGRGSARGLESRMGAPGRSGSSTPRAVEAQPSSSNLTPARYTGTEIAL